MHERDSGIPAAWNPRAWPSVLARYREPSLVMGPDGVLELVLDVEQPDANRSRRLISFREMYILTSVINKRTAVAPNRA